MNEPKYIYRLEQVENGGSKTIGDFTTLHQAMNTARTPVNSGTWSELTNALVYNFDTKRLPADRAYDRLRAMSYHIERYYAFDRQRVCPESLKLPHSIP